ncbi:MAG: hypothetical protein LBL92_04475 [Propionibacteriaceae bacterium]|jgi:hypothetical protein|nr:hypothetical protein [Propionibacteriaceae bacterium]
MAVSMPQLGQTPDLSITNPHSNWGIHGGRDGWPSLVDGEGLMSRNNARSMVIWRAAAQGCAVLVSSSAVMIILVLLMGQSVQDRWGSVVVGGLSCAYIYLTGKYEKWRRWPDYNWREKDQAKERPPTPF